LIIIIFVLSDCTWEQILQNNQNESYVQDKKNTIIDIQEAELLTPGEHTINAPIAGISFIVYVPMDYNPDNSFPIVFCYHGAGRSATTWPFYQVTHGKGYIIVGMNYTPSAEKGTNLLSIKTEKAFFDEVLDILTKRLNIDQRMILMGGYSQGGYHTSLLGERLIDKLAGLIILGAGRFTAERYPPLLKSISGKPIFIGVGEQDIGHKTRAKVAANVYQSWNADVTYEEWPGVGHHINTPEFPSKILLEWMNNVCQKRRSIQKR
ncbi:MAG: hypothetical protein ACUVWN_17825, partial [bacterium]